MRETKYGWVGKQEGDPEPIIYLSGCARSIGLDEPELLQTTGYRFRCASFAYCGETSPWRMRQHVASFEFLVKQRGVVRLFVDSGAHTFHEKLAPKLERRTRVSSVDRLSRRTTVDEIVEDYLSKYTKWVRGLPADRFDFIVTLDYETRCPTVHRVTQAMRKAGVDAIPVYHGDSDLSWLKRYADGGYRLIGVGWNPTLDSRRSRRRYYDQVFDYAARFRTPTYLHGFACTGSDAFAYPWHSVDSATWIKAAGFGFIVDVKPGTSPPKVVTIPVSDKRIDEGLRADPDLRQRVEARGFDLDLLGREIKQRALYNIGTFRRLQETATRRKTSRTGWGVLF